MPSYPFTGAITDYFGPRESPGGIGSTNHLGLDGDGDGNFMPESGQLISYGYAGGYGYLAVVLGSSGWWHYLAHHRDPSPLVPFYTWLAERTKVAEMGTTGNSTGRHCHWETRLPGGAPGIPINPLEWLAQATAAAGLDVTPIIQTGGIPMFNLIKVPDLKQIVVQGLDGRREGVQSKAHLDALIAYRNGMLTPGDPMTMYYGDFVGNRGSIDWYLARVNGPRGAAADPDNDPIEFSDEDLAKIGAAIDIDFDALLARIAKLDDAEHAQLLTAINKPRTLS